MERFCVPTTVCFGPGALDALGELTGRRVLVVTDAFLARSGLLDQILSRLTGCTVETFTDVVPDPPLDVVAKGVHKVEEFRPDALVAFGGGSPMDCAKAMAHFSTLRRPSGPSPPLRAPGRRSPPSPSSPTVRRGLSTPWWTTACCRTRPCWSPPF